LTKNLLRLKAQAALLGYKLVKIKEPPPPIPDQWECMDQLPFGDYDDDYLPLCDVSMQVLTCRTANSLSRAHFTKRRLWEATPADVFACKHIGHKSLDEINAWRRHYLDHLRSAA
jgi:DNA-directed RNA polymerase alpha subunit